MTDLELINSALGRLGVERIASLSEDSKRAKIANDFLEIAKKATLEMTPWDFAIKRAKLTSSGTPEFEYSYSFNKPVDLIKIVKEYNGYEYKIEGSKILSDSSTLSIVYIADIDESVIKTPTFYKAWYLTLASEMAYSLTQNTALKDSLLAEAERVAGTAGSLNAMGSSPISYEIDYLTLSRL